MRNVMYALALVLIVSSCSKTEVKKNDVQSTPEVSAWLQAQKDGTTIQKKIDAVEQLSKHLDYSKARFEEWNQANKLFVVPIRDEFRELMGVNSNSTMTFVAQINNSGSIEKGNVVVYTPSGSQSIQSIPENTFSRIFNDKKLDINGNFRFCSVSGNLLFKLDYENGKLKAFGTYGKDRKLADDNSPAIQTTCVGWYLTTTYYVDGVVTDVTQELLWMDCSGSGSGTMDPYVLCMDV